MENEFLKFLKKHSTEQWKLMEDTIISFGCIVNLKWEVKIDKEMLEEFLLSDKVQFFMVSDADGHKFMYHFDGIPIDPVSYYILPEGTRNVDVLEILQECVKQNTHKPDIKHLQEKKDENN